MRIIVNPVASKLLSDRGVDIARSRMKYRYESWRPPKKNEYGKQRVVYTKYLVYANGDFLTGYLPRVCQLLKKHNITPDIKYQRKMPNAHAYDISLRDYQQEAVEKAIQRKRGVIVAPTGSGKTHMGIAILQAFQGYNRIFIVPSKSLLAQTYNVFKPIFGENVGRIGDGITEPNIITVALINTLSKYANTDYLNLLDVMIVDECHRIKNKGMYADVLEGTTAPVRLGLTASPPNINDDIARTFALEGYIGPKIHVVEHQGLVGKVLAKPRVEVIRVPRRGWIRDIKGYNNVYTKAVVENKLLNKRALEKSVDLILEKNLTVLTMVKRIDHGKILQDMFQRMYSKTGIQCKFLYSETETQERENIRIALDKGEIQLAITTTIWKEGVDIPSLGAIVNVAGGKEEIPVIQWMGRGMRKPEGKEELIIVDFFDDSHHYLISHFGNRLCLYFEQEWM